MQTTKTTFKLVTFKSLNISDIDTVVKMMEDFYAIDDYQFETEIANKLFLEFLENENLGKCWLIYNYVDIVGYAIITYVFSFEYKGKIAFFEELFINKSARGKGIGKLAIDFVKDEAEKSNLKMLYLEVENHNKIAQKLYKANGFKIHNRQILKLAT